MEGEEKKGLRGKRRGPKKTLIVRTNPLAILASGAPGSLPQQAEV
jgi:hypothetical protein